MTLQGLPYEVLFYIVQEISLEDVFNLSLTCKWFCYLSDDDRTCKALLEVRGATSPITSLRAFLGPAQPGRKGKERCFPT